MQGLRDNVTLQTKPILLALLGAASLVLLIARTSRPYVAVLVPVSYL